MAHYFTALVSAGHSHLVRVLLAVDLHVFNLRRPLKLELGPDGLLHPPA